MNHVLTQDNGACNGHKKLSVSISDEDLRIELRRFFKWRKDVTLARLQREGSRKYDLFIKSLYDKGYRKEASV